MTIWLSRKESAAENSRHLEDIKRQDKIRSADAEQERLQREVDYDKQKELFASERMARLIEDQEAKNTLILHILTEIHAVQNFLIIYPQPQFIGHDFEIGAITGTVPQQVQFFKSNGLISKLTEYRTFANKLMKDCNTLKDLGKQPYPGDNAAYSIIRGNWNSTINNGKRLNAELLALLLNEYSGEVPKEIQKLRVG